MQNMQLTAKVDLTTHNNSLSLTGYAKCPLFLNIHQQAITLKF